MRTLCLLLLCSIVLFKAAGQAGSLDSTFGNKGIQTTAFLSNANTLDEEGREVLTSTNGDIFVVVLVGHAARVAKYLPDGRLDSSFGDAGYSNVVNLYVVSAAMQGDKIIVVGPADNHVNGTSDFTLARYTVNGALDTSFGENGIVMTDFDSSNDAAASIALQENKIIVAGYTIKNLSSDFALARYTADGALDSSFGENGKVITDFNSSLDFAYSVTLQGDKILVSGNTNNPANGTYDFALARYTANGVLDSTFGENGKVMTDFSGSSDDVATSIATQGSKIIVAGYTYNPANGTYDFALVCYTTDGVLDLTFGENGKVTTDFDNSDDFAQSLIFQEDKIIVVGYNHIPEAFNNTDFVLARYTVSGALDTSFGENGRVTADFNSSADGANSVALQGDRIIVAGYTVSPVNFNYDFALIGYKDDGALDPSFGENGLLTGHFPTSKINFTSTAIQGNKIIAAGYALNDSNSYVFALARYTADGSLDASFGVKGIATTDFNSPDNGARSIALQGDKIIVAGITYNPVSFNSDFALARYTADGVLDTSFGENGSVTTDFNNSSDDANSIAIQDNKIIVAGYTSNLNGIDFALARYTADGALDSSFGENGQVVTDFSGFSDIANAIALQEGKIILGGFSYNPVTGNDDFALARYTADGALDASFGDNGKVITDFNNLNDRATSIALQGDKIIVAGYNTDFALASYTVDGRLDSSFGENGKVTTDLSGFFPDGANSIVLQGNKIIAGGYAYNTVDNNSDFALVRYTPDGKLDPSFGENGAAITVLNGIASIQAIALHENRLYAVGNLTLIAGDTYGVVAAYQLEASEPTEPTISIADVTVPESKYLAIVTARLSKPTTKLVRVHFTTRGKTAISPQDYLPVRGTLLFIPGVNTTFKIYIPLVDDKECEGAEQFEVLLADARNATIQDSIGVVTILDDDNALITKQSTSLRIQANPNPSASAFTVQLLGSNLKQPVNISVYDISGRLLEQREHLSIGQSLRLGDRYKAGTYIIEALQGNRSVQTKVIKTGK